MDPMKRLDARGQELFFAMFVTACQEKVHETLRTQLSEETPLVGHQMAAFVSFAVHMAMKQMGVENARELMDRHVERFANNMSQLSKGITFGEIDYYGEMMSAINRYDLIMKKSREPVPVIERAFAGFVCRFDRVDTDGLFSTTVRAVLEHPLFSTSSV